MINLNTAKTTLALLIKQNKNHKPLVNQINAVFDFLVNQDQTITTQGTEIMNIQKLVQLAEARIIGLVNDSQKLKSDAEAAAATASSSIKTLQSQIDSMQKTIDDMSHQQVVDAASETELNKLADLLKVDPNTLEPLP